MRLLTLFIAFYLASTTVSGQQLTKLWEVSGLKQPESAVKHKNFYYISNISGKATEKNGAGFISKVTLDGKMISRQWATGFNAPKGMMVSKGKLYVADIDVIREVDLASGRITASFPAEGATFLNDITASANGDIYVSDTFGGNAIYKLSRGKVSLWLKDDKLDYPNGLMIDGKNIIVASWGMSADPKDPDKIIPGKIIAVNLKDKSMRDRSTSIGNLDGLVLLKKDSYLVSDWVAGGLMIIDASGKKTDLMDLNAGSADLTYIKKNRTLLVPQMNDGTLVAYRIGK